MLYQEIVMTTLTDQVKALTVSDIMTRDVLVIPKSMSLRTAAHLLAEIHISGAPVVDENGACVGVISSTDFVHWADRERRVGRKPGQSDCVCTAWQMVEFDQLPAEVVSNYMTPDPVIVSPQMNLRDLARAMVDAHIHRVIVTDDCKRPVGLVSSTDVLAAVARTEPAE
jgi:CBS domain-containing protein